MENQEIECRFLEINKDALVEKLTALGAHDEGEQMIQETVIYDSELKWRDAQRFVRLGKIGDKTKLTYKDQSVATVDGTFEQDLGNPCCQARAQIEVSEGAPRFNSGQAGAGEKKRWWSSFRILKTAIVFSVIPHPQTERFQSRLDLRAVICSSAAMLCLGICSGTRLRASPLFRSRP